MTRYFSFERFGRTSAGCAEASSCCATLSAMDAAFAVSIFVMSLLALRLRGIIIAMAIIIGIIVSGKANLSERAVTIAA